MNLPCFRAVLWNVGSDCTLVTCVWLYDLLSGQFIHSLYVHCMYSLYVYLYCFYYCFYILFLLYIFLFIVLCVFLYFIITAALCVLINGLQINTNFNQSGAHNAGCAHGSAPTRALPWAQRCMRVDSSPWLRRNALTGAQLNATRFWKQFAWLLLTKNK